MKEARVILLRLWLIGLVFSGLGTLAFAQAGNYPHKPIRIVVPYPPGGGGDIIANVVGQRLTSEWGQRVLIDNRPGASGMIGTAYEAHEAVADGYSILLATDIQFSINPALYRKITYDPDKDFEPLALGAVTYFGLETTSSLNVNSLAQFIALAKSEPGRLDYGSAGIGSSHQMGMELLKQLAHIDVVHIPYSGGTPALLDLVAGRIQAMYVGVAHTRQLIQTGKVKLLAVGSPKRLEAFPAIPAISETFPGFDVNARWDFYAPARTPPEIVRKLSSQILTILKNPDVVNRLSAVGIGVTPGGPAELLARNRAERAKWREVIAKAGIALQ